MGSRGRVMAAIGLSALVAIVASCSDLKRADEDPSLVDGGNGDSGGELDGEGPTDGSTVDTGPTDAGPAPDDFECSGDEWTKPSKTKKECEARQVKVLTAVSPIDVNAIAIARTPTGRVGIVFNSEEGAETGEMHLLHFTPITAVYPAPVLVKRATGFAFHDGYVSKIAASAPDTLSVLTYDMDDTSFSGEVHLRKLVAGKEPLTDDLAFTAVKNPTEIAIASDPAGNVVATARKAPSVGTTATLAAAAKTPTGVFSPLPNLATTLLPAQAPGVGAVSILFDPGSQVHLLYHHNEVMQHSNPRYHDLAGTTWSYRKTVDNNVIDGLSGYSPRIAVFGTKKYAAYFFRKAQQAAGVGVADLRLASWEGAMDTPSIEILEQGIPSVDPMYPAYRVAMAVDKFGLVHVAFITPSSTTLGVLEYKRQTRVAGGGTKWLSDIVDGDVFSPTSDAFVDMVVDENARPHIAYRSGKDGKVRYATRYDR